MRKLGGERDHLVVVFGRRDDRAAEPHRKRQLPQRIHGLLRRAAGHQKVARAVEQAVFAFRKAVALFSGHGMAAHKAEAVGLGELFQVGADRALDAAGVGDDAAFPDLRAVLPHKIDAGFRVHAQIQKIRILQVPGAAPARNGPAFHRPAEHLFVGVYPDDPVFCARRQRFCKRSADQP